MVDITNRVVPMMKAQGDGDIVNIASTSGTKGAKGATVYAGSKWAVRGISQCWQAELRPHGISVISILPSEVQTNWMGKTGRNNPNKLYADGHRRDDLRRPRHAAPRAVAGVGDLREQSLERGLEAHGDRVVGSWQLTVASCGKRQVFRFRCILRSHDNAPWLRDNRNARQRRGGATGSRAASRHAARDGGAEGRLLHHQATASRFIT